MTFFPMSAPALNASLASRFSAAASLARAVSLDVVPVAGRLVSVVVVSCAPPGIGRSEEG
jgi:hypothetical protein